MGFLLKLLIGTDNLPDAQGAQGNRSIGYKNLDHQYTLKVETGEHGHYFIQVGLGMSGRDNVGVKQQF
jgi:hypothetical protein